MPKQPAISGLRNATIIDVPSSTKNMAKARDPKMLSTKKGNDLYVGMKAHFCIDDDSGIVDSLEATTAQTHNTRIWDELLHGKVKWSQKSGQLAKVYPTTLEGYEDGETPEVYRSVQGQGRASVPDPQAPVRPRENPLPGSRKKPSASVEADRARQPVPDATEARCMRRNPPEIGETAAQAAKTARKSLETEPVWPQSGLNLQRRPNRRR